MNVEKREGVKIQIPIKLTRASIGPADYVFAVLETVEGGGLVAYPARDNISIIEQPVQDELSALLTVELVEEKDDHFIVSLNDGRELKKLRVNKKEMKVEAFTLSVKMEYFQPF